jgi:hypothetical protein
MAQAETVPSQCFIWCMDEQETIGVESGMNTKWNRKWVVRLGLISGCTLALTVFVLSWGVKTRAQEHTPVHMTTDWSNRHMVYSSPSSMSQAWRLQAEPRYLHQWTRRNVVPQPQAAQ